MRGKRIRKKRPHTQPWPRIINKVREEVRMRKGEEGYFWLSILRWMQTFIQTKVEIKYANDVIMRRLTSMMMSTRKGQTVGPIIFMLWSTTEQLVYFLKKPG